jgi:hypothetical protein
MRVNGGTIELLERLDTPEAPRILPLDANPFAG